MSITFYSHPVSNFCAKVEIVLRLKGMIFEPCAPPGGYGSEEYKARVPSGTIPAIVSGDLVLSESETINEYLDEISPEPPLLPGSPAERARIRQIARFHDTRLEPPIRALFPMMAPASRDAARIERHLAEIRQRLADLEAMVSPAPFLCGERPTLADIPYPATLLLAEAMLDALGISLELPPRLRAWRPVIGSLPEVAAVLERSREATSAWLRSKGAIAG